MRCSGCGAELSLHPYFRLTKWGTLRLEMGCAFTVNGNGAWCARCIPNSVRNGLAQRETWTEFDRRNAGAEEPEPA